MAFKVHVIFRTCDIVNSVHNVPRPFGLDKLSLIQICFLSLREALQTVEHRITILGDRLSDASLEFFSQFDVAVENGTFGNDKSILRSIDLACASEPEEWVYLCEDDYLHTADCFTRIEDLVRNRDEYLATRPTVRLLRGAEQFHDVPLVIHTPDYPDRYQRRRRRFSLLFLSKYCHWRQISNTTFTLLAEGKTFRKYEQIFRSSSKGADDGYLSKHLYGQFLFGRKALCLSPIPGLASHMHEGVETPLVDWKSVVERYRKVVSEKAFR